jgi:hypothetical protein
MNGISLICVREAQDTRLAAVFSVLVFMGVPGWTEERGR